ncbi:hypothetical protein [Phenylobacterium sp.]|uniref:hypothetical protein n=1 Tax=Phenylobacterium sp. TaxID=1871053 RepID=UPI0027304E4F|nr:hypothetical protein [Phenylobacterium sp.]MDP1873682.1 hypothetical protein [Phenylobacterium sp.]
MSGVLHCRLLTGGNDMRSLLIGVLLAALAPAVASAQWVPMVPSPPEIPTYGGYEAPAPYRAPQTTYDYQSGNVYRTTPSYGGSTTVRGSNLNTGSTWTTRVDPNGNMRGTDASGNLWQYNSQTGSYISSDGTTCIGKGYARVCN